MLKVPIINCINILPGSGLVYCKHCEAMVGICDYLDDEYIVTFINVREVVFRPHTSYLKVIDLEGQEPQQVSFMEMMELSEGASLQPLDILNNLIVPVDEDNKNPAESPTVRVAAFATHGLFGVDQHRVLDRLKSVLIEESGMNEKEMVPMTSILPGTPTKNFPNPIEIDDISNIDMNEFLQLNKTEFDFSLFGDN